MRALRPLVATVLLLVPFPCAGGSKIDVGACAFSGKKLYGKIQIVTSFPDVKVQKVDAFPDLKVQIVKAFPDKCGMWQLVDAFPETKVQFVDAFPDVKVKYVEAFPGVP